MRVVVVVAELSNSFSEDPAEVRCVEHPATLSGRLGATGGTQHAASRGRPGLSSRRLTVGQPAVNSLRRISTSCRPRLRPARPIANRTPSVTGTSVRMIETHFGALIDMARESPLDRLRRLEYDDARSPEFPLGVELETFIRREDAERFVAEVRGDDPDVASYLRIEGARAPGGRADRGEPRCNRLRRLVRGICTAP